MGRYRGYTTQRLLLATEPVLCRAAQCGHAAHALNIKHSSWLPRAGRFVSANSLPCATQLRPTAKTRGAQVKTFTVSLSNDSKSYTSAPCSKTNTQGYCIGNTDKDTRVTNALNTSAQARYVRINVKSYNGFASMRMGVSVCAVQNSTGGDCELYRLSSERVVGGVHRPCVRARIIFIYKQPRDNTIRSLL